MIDPPEFTPQQAADPSTPGEVLAAIAGSRPDLRPFVAANPSAYPGLLDWLARLGDPAVDAALAARSDRVGPAPWAWSPGGLQDGPVAPAGTGESAYGQSPGRPGTPSGAFSPPPGAGTPASSGWAPGAAPRRASTLIWVAVGVVLLGVLVGALFLGSRAITAAREGLGDVLSGEEPFAYGDDPALDALWDDCAEGDMAACDDLYRESPYGSQYEDFGDTCGGRTEGGTWCAE